MTAMKKIGAGGPTRARALGLGAAAALILGALAPTAALAQDEPILGQVTLFGTTWCPRGWAPANGQILPISQNSALFSLYGTTYGGNGTTTFGLPDLRGRAPVSYNATIPLGAPIGSGTATLTVDQMPTHNHIVLAAATGPTSNDPANGSLATFPAGAMIYASPSETPSVPMHPNVVTNTGGNQPFSTQSPILSMNWCVAMVGVYPSRP